jgi:ABC-type nitrate/sulfonate/bicarbonate transport system substrate-binding protein
MKTRNVLIASAIAVTMLAAGCSSGGAGGGAPLKLEKTSIVVDAFPAIDSAGLYIAQTEGLFAAQGLHVTIVSTPRTHRPHRT